MSTKPGKFCLKFPCRNMAVVGSAYCQDHQRPAWQHDNEVPRIRGRRLQHIREQHFARHPLCAICERQGIVRPATILDHITPLAEGGQDIESNRQGVCRECSDRKTAQEAKRGRERRQKSSGSYARKPLR